jgi:hypothetical protein
MEQFMRVTLILVLAYFLCCFGVAQAAWQVAPIDEDRYPIPHHDLSVINGKPMIVYVKERTDSGPRLKFSASSTVTGSAPDNWTYQRDPAALIQPLSEGSPCAVINLPGLNSVIYKNNGRLQLFGTDCAGAWRSSTSVPLNSNNVGNIMGWRVLSGRLVLLTANPADSTLWLHCAGLAAPWPGSSLTSAGIASDLATLEVVGSEPAIAFYQAQTNDLFYTRRSGAAWSSKVRVGNTDPLGINLRRVVMRVVAGRPYIVFSSGPGVMFTRAADTTGASWSTPAKIPDAHRAHGFDLEVDGLGPMLVYNSEANDHVSFRRGSLDGTAWTAAAEQFFDGVPATIDLELVDGKPAVSFYTTKQGVSTSLWYAIRLP